MPSFLRLSSLAFFSAGVISDGRFANGAVDFFLRSEIDFLRFAVYFSLPGFGPYPDLIASSTDSSLALCAPSTLLKNAFFSSSDISVRDLPAFFSIASNLALYPSSSSDSSETFAPRPCFTRYLPDASLWTTPLFFLA